MHSALIKKQKLPLAVHRLQPWSRSLNHSVASPRLYAPGHTVDVAFLMHASPECAFSFSIRNMSSRNRNEKARSGEAKVWSFIHSYALAMNEAPNLLQDNF